MLILHRFAAMHALDKVGDDLHRPGAEKSYDGDHVLHRLRPHLHDIARHTHAFHLEEAHGMAIADELVDRLVINGDAVQIEGFAMALADQVAGPGHDRERHQA